MSQISLSATLVGLEVPADGNRSLDVKPFVIGDLITDRAAAPPVSNDPDGDLGLDVKYGITENMVADLTVNTDFAQVEADEQQVNLTRFSLFFPEKREFFLENQGAFAFGGAGANLFGGGGNTAHPVLQSPDRSERGAGGPDRCGRTTDRSDRRVQCGCAEYSDTRRAADCHALHQSCGPPCETESAPPQQRRGDRHAPVCLTQSTGSNETYGLDGTFAFYENVRINTYWATTRTRGMTDDISYRGQFDYGGDRYGVQAERLVVGSGFNPEVGFLRRQGFERSFGSLRFSPRPQAVATIRKLSWSGHLDYITDRSGVLESREAQGRFGIELENGDNYDATYTSSYEFLKQPFRIASDVSVPVGGYTFQDVQTSYSFGSQRRLAGRLSLKHGGFFGGELTSAGFSGGRFEVTPQLSLEPSVSVNWIDLPEGTFTTGLVTARTTYTISPLMFVSALVQYNSSNDSLGANLRLRWEYQPGSELFVVYNEQRDTMTRGYPELENRAFVIKINRLFRF